jgi:ATP-dependent exoDNAse (exonuclease V) beta subunit
MMADLLAADTAARVMALTALDRTLLVEAGAGSGKTSVLAGRVASLLAAGRRPREIAAITFTEIAAGELRERVCLFVAELARGHVRRDLEAAFPGGPSSEQRVLLGKAEGEMDELVCTTIHGFCQRLLTPYPVEAGMDPGASVMDGAAADTLFREVLDKWMWDRLSGERRPDDLLLALYADDARSTDKLLRGIAQAMRKYRGASTPEILARNDIVLELRDATAAFRTFLNKAPCKEDVTLQMVSDLEALLLTIPRHDGSEVEILLYLLRLPVPVSCTHQQRFSAFTRGYTRKGKWEAALKAAGLKSHGGAALNEAAAACFASCHDAYAATRAYAAGRVLHILAGEVIEVIDRFNTAKRNKALTDFDDLLIKARDLLRQHEAVRAALGRRFAAVLVDEFQDTDSFQCEILWRLCATPDSERPWQEWALRPGALFLVGDPKQAIYRFRGADVGSYVAARTRLVTSDTSTRLVIGQNFRSYAPILDWVNNHFADTLARDGQPGFEPLFTHATAPDGHLAVASLQVAVDGTGANVMRDAEADAIAACCARLIGALVVRGREGPRRCRPDDIALLAPTGTELWRYERALELAGIAVSTQAGKGFYRRQEVQDLIALTRVLADSRDTLALGALLRGPLIGMTEEELLDATGVLPEANGEPGRLRLWTELSDIRHLLLRDTLAILQDLARQARSTTPFVLLCKAVEELQVRPVLRQRQGRTAERALANLDLFLESARPYDIRGLHAFSAELRAQWDEARRTMEGRPDTEEQSVSLVTMHSSKGLEWPIVIPINMGGRPYDQMDAVLDAEGRLHLPVSGLHGPDGKAAFDAEADEEARQRHRLWYVGATRARDLLLLPQFSTGVPAKSWMEHVGLSHDNLVSLDAAALQQPSLYRTEDAPNNQDRSRFDTEAALIASRLHRLRRITPHLAEAGDPINPGAAPLPPHPDDVSPLESPLRGSRLRGLVLHKLMEEVLTGETRDAEKDLISRAEELARQVTGLADAEDFDGKEAARAVRRGLSVPAVAAIRDRLLPECPIAHSETDEEGEVVTIGVADAAVWNGSHIELVIDWKSDVSPGPDMIARYRKQVFSYLNATNAPAGLIVFLTSGAVEHVANRMGEL